MSCVTSTLLAAAAAEWTWLTTHVNGPTHLPSTSSMSYSWAHRHTLEMSGNVFFNPSPSHWFPTVYFHYHSHSQVQPAFIAIPFPVPSVILISCRYQSHTSISLHPLLFFMNIMKQITSKLMTSGSLSISKTTNDHINPHRLTPLSFYSVGSPDLKLPDTTLFATVFFLEIFKPIFRLYGNTSKTCWPVFQPYGDL